ncbi:unnamed protein product [Kuraishia capsulata CBS 1993]|uniref:Uncharacterized protein n=1 Tax=Kuraishia capsulata CBS 1993 TaxID=1382522 RepID=W6MTX7_9ASCO|nr:uncharacterized protein KUCA_T00004716001 [Kuraishia capsulata CBS 1993]CDK28732.1 unnamed protein product [Kuraishia capsulata CBS 1993]
MFPQSFPTFCVRTPKMTRREVEERRCYRPNIHKPPDQALKLEIAQLFRRFTEMDDISVGERHIDDSQSVISSQGSLQSPTESSTTTTPPGLHKEVDGFRRVYEEGKLQGVSSEDIITMDEDICHFFEYLNDLLHTIEERSDLKENEDRKAIEGLIEKTRAMVLKLSLSRNLSNFHTKTNQEHSDMERTIMTKSLETFQKNLSMLQMSNEALHSKNIELMKRYRTLKDRKLRSLKLQNLQQKKELQQLRSQLGQQGTETNDSQNLLNTLGMLASHVLEDGKT